MKKIYLAIIILIIGCLCGCKSQEFTVLEERIIALEHKIETLENVTPAPSYMSESLATPEVTLDSGSEKQLIVGIDGYVSPVLNSDFYIKYENKNLYINTYTTLEEAKDNPIRSPAATLCPPSPLYFSGYSTNPLEKVIITGSPDADFSGETILSIKPDDKNQFEFHHWPYCNVISRSFELVFSDGTSKFFHIQID